MSDFQPTEEQRAALSAFRTGGNVVLAAGAGTGKTSTLKLLARSDPSRRGVYFAFNRSVADEAAAEFPTNVSCSTLHSLASRAVMTPARRQRLNAPRQNAHVVARILGISGPTRVSDQVVLAPNQLANIAMETVKRFCSSGDEHVLRKHMPFRPGLEDHQTRRTLAEAVGPFARRAWADLRSGDGQLRLEHDHYLKAWALTHPVLPNVDYMFVDEAQDSNGVTIGIVRDHAAAGAQIITVGDENQAIYGWRGAQDAMAEFGGARLTLTQSFRFGPAIANEANKWLRVLDADLRVKGTPLTLSVIGHLDGVDDASTPDAILTRTNAEAVVRLMDFESNGVPATIVGGGQQIRSLAEASEQLQETGRTWHPELVAFTSWGQVQDYVENDHGGSDLATAVKLIDAWGAPAIIRAVGGMADEKTARVTISTAHKAKGREWNRVRIAGDFPAPKPDDNGRTEVAREDAMLAYVAVTRAKKVLDPFGLDWIDEYLAQPRGVAPAA